MGPGKQLSFLILLVVITSYAVADSEDAEEQLMHPRLPPTIRTNQKQIRAGEETQSFWLKQAKKFIRQQANAKVNTKKAKNIILFLGDGMGLTTLAAARNYIGGEEQSLSFEKFPYTGLSKTYSVDKIVPDSACTSTAYLCGVKANYGTIGVNGLVERDDCEAMRNTSNHVYSIAKWAMDAGKSAGLVTTARVTHASPAGVYAHTADREWENDSELEETCGPDSGLDDIAVQLIHGEVGSKLKVMLGGGKKMFYDPVHYKKGLRKDGRNLVEEFEKQSTKNVFVDTKKKLSKVNVDETERLLGLFTKGHMDYHLETLQNEEENKQPTLEEMTRKAIEVLQTDDEGYFLFVEGGKIDMGHHYAWSRLALDETAEFSKAIEAALNLTSDDNTLIVVTADHSHTFSVAGYQDRGSNIFSVASSVGTDDTPYLSLSYANGPGFEKHYNTEKYKRFNPTKVQSGAHDDIFPGTVPLIKETHGGEDVAVFAKGPFSHLFTGVFEQNAIPHMMAYAACVGHGMKACED